MSFNPSIWFHRNLTKTWIYFLILLVSMVLILFFIYQLSFNSDEFKFHMYYFFGANMPKEVDPNHPTHPWHYHYLFLKILGVFIFTGLLVAAFSSGVERYVERVREGRKHFCLSDHYVMIGFNNYSLSVIENMLAGNKSKLVILTRIKPMKVRASLRASLPQEIDHRIIIYAGDGNTDNHVSHLNLDKATGACIMAEGNEWENQYTQSMTLLKEVARHAGQRVASHYGLLPVSVFLNEFSSYDFVQRIAFPRDYYGTVNDGIFSQSLDLHISNFFDNWARLLWSFKGKKAGDGYAYDALDFEPIEDTDKWVHLVIVGFNQMGRALALEALRIAHYPNFDEHTGQNKTVITVIDTDATRLEEQWRTYYPHLAQITDIDMEFIAQDVENYEVRDKLKTWAIDPRQMLTIAVCVTDPDTSMTVALSLPEEVYAPSPAAGSSPSRARVLVRQHIKETLNDIFSCSPIYENVKFFGSFLNGYDKSLLDDRLAICVNGIYVTDELRNMLGNDDGEQQLAHVDYGSRYEAWGERWLNLEPDGTPETHKIASRSQVDFYRTLLPILERASKRGTDEETRIKELLAASEHRRWVAERTLAGWRQARDGECRNNALKIHDAIIPYEQLSAAERLKDKNVVAFAPVLVDFVQNSFSSTSTHKS